LTEINFLQRIKMLAISMTFRNSLVLVCIVILLFQKVLAEKAPLDPENQDDEMVEEQGSAIDSGGQEGSFLQGFVETFSVIVVSELGDKTFFIAAIMAMMCRIRACRCTSSNDAPHSTLTFRHSST